MCYGGNCCHCISLEIGCLIFGYFQAVFFGATLLVLEGINAGVCGLNPAQTCKEWDNLHNYCRQYETEIQYMKINACLQWNAQAIPMSLAFFVFSSLLVYGVHKKISSFVMAYFAFGIVALGMSSIYFLVSTIAGYLVCIAGLLAAVIYSHLLAMVYQTAKKIENKDQSSVQEPIAGTSTVRAAAPPPYGKCGDVNILEV